MDNKFRDIGTVERRQGSGGPRCARTDENTDQVNVWFDSTGSAPSSQHSP